MNCMICGRNGKEGENSCPVCHFPHVILPCAGDGNGVNEIEKISGELSAYRSRFLEKVDIGVVIYYWKGENGVIVPDGEERISFGTGKALYGQTVWLPVKFARIPGEERVPVRVSVRWEGREEEQMFFIPNLEEARLQALGAVLDSGMELQLFAGNGTGVVSSRKQPLFPG